MFKVIKILIVISVLIFLLIGFLYYNNHESNEQIYSLAKNEIEANKESYKNLYEYIKEFTNDSFPSSGFSYRRGWNYIMFAIYDKNNKEENSHKQVPFFADNLRRNFGVSYNMKTNSMKVSLDYSNYRLERTKIIYSPNLSIIINNLISKGYTYFDKIEPKMKYENCIIKLNDYWLLSFYQDKW